MADQFVVPQFLDVEPKIIGPITGRQFLIMLGTLMLGFLTYRIFIRSPLIFIPLICFIVGVGASFAFAKVNGQAFHFIVLNMIQTLRKPSIRVWDKSLTDQELQDRMKDTADAKKKDGGSPDISPKQLRGSRLSELSLMVDTGGMYDPKGDLVM